MAQLGAEQDQGPVLYLPPLSDPAPLDVVQDFLSGQHLGVDDGVDAHGAEEVAVFGQRVLVVVDAGYRLPGPELRGQHAGRHVVCLVGRDPDEEVCPVDFGLLQRIDRGGRERQGEYVEVRRKVLQLFGRFVHERDVVVLL